MRSWAKPRRTCLLTDLVIRHEFRARLEDVRMITVDGDLMEPLLPTGHGIPVQVSQRLPVPRGILRGWGWMGRITKQSTHMRHLFGGALSAGIPPPPPPPPRGGGL